MSRGKSLQLITSKNRMPEDSIKQGKVILIDHTQKDRTPENSIDQTQIFLIDHTKREECMRTPLSKGKPFYLITSKSRMSEDSVEKKDKLL